MGQILFGINPAALGLDAFGVPAQVVRADAKKGISIQSTGTRYVTNSRSNPNNLVGTNNLQEAIDNGPKPVQITLNNQRLQNALKHPDGTITGVLNGRAFTQYPDGSQEFRQGGRVVERRTRNRQGQTIVSFNAQGKKTSEIRVGPDGKAASRKFYGQKLGGQEVGVEHKPDGARIIFDPKTGKPKQIEVREVDPKTGDATGNLIVTTVGADGQRTRQVRPNPQIMAQRRQAETMRAETSTQAQAALKRNAGKSDLELAFWQTLDNAEQGVKNGLQGIANLPQTLPQAAGEFMQNREAVGAYLKQNPGAWVDAAKITFLDPVLALGHGANSFGRQVTADRNTVRSGSPHTAASTRDVLDANGIDSTNPLVRLTSSIGEGLGTTAHAALRRIPYNMAEMYTQGSLGSQADSIRAQFADTPEAGTRDKWSRLGRDAVEMLSLVLEAPKLAINNLPPAASALAMADNGAARSIPIPQAAVQQGGRPGVNLAASVLSSTMGGQTPENTSHGSASAPAEYRPREGSHAAAPPASAGRTRGSRPGQGNSRHTPATSRKVDESGMSGIPRNPRRSTSQQRGTRNSDPLQLAKPEKVFNPSFEKLQALIRGATSVLPSPAASFRGFAMLPAHTFAPIHHTVLRALNELGPSRFRDAGQEMTGQAVAVGFDLSDWTNAPDLLQGPLVLIKKALDFPKEASPLDVLLQLRQAARQGVDLRASVRQALDAMPGGTGSIQKSLIDSKLMDELLASVQRGDSQFLPSTDAIRQAEDILSSAPTLREFKNQGPRPADIQRARSPQASGNAAVDDWIAPNAPRESAPVVAALTDDISAALGIPGTEWGTLRNILQQGQQQGRNIPELVRNGLHWHDNPMGLRAGPGQSRADIVAESPLLKELLANLDTAQFKPSQAAVTHYTENVLHNTMAKQVAERLSDKRVKSATLAALRLGYKNAHLPDYIQAVHQLASTPLPAWVQFINPSSTPNPLGAMVLRAPSLRR
jgi:hypothetical protein